MSLDQLMLLSPFVVLGAAIVLLLISTALYRSRRVTHSIAVFTFIAAIVALAGSHTAGSGYVAPLFLIDGFARCYIAMICVVGLVTALLSRDYLARHRYPEEEFYILLLLASLGASLLVATGHFAAFFLGMELLSISLYGLIAYFRDFDNAAEAGLKYLVLAGVSSALMLFGIALAYAVTGSLAFSGVAEYIRSVAAIPYILAAAIALIMIGIAFKLALTPLHIWTPDVYQGAPAPVAGFIATASKGAIFGLLLRWWAMADLAETPAVFAIIVVPAVASMFVGNFLALRQHSVKRMLAYSSITHMGYLLAMVLVPGKIGIAAATFYLAAYFVTMLAAFGILGSLSKLRRDADSITDLRALAYTQPWLGAAFTAVLFSLAGIPFTAGFVAKFYIIVAGLGANLWILMVLIALNSAIGLFYYLRIVAAMYRHVSIESPAPDRSIPLLTAAALAMLILLLVWLGIFPQPAIDAVERLTAQFLLAR